VVTTDMSYIGTPWAGIDQGRGDAMKPLIANIIEVIEDLLDTAMSTKANGSLFTQVGAQVRAALHSEEMPDVVANAIAFALWDTLDAGQAGGGQVEDLDGP